MPDQINRVFQLAFFVLADRELAIRVSSEAVEGLEMSSRHQHKRTYYKAIRSSRKVTWHDEGLLEVLAMSATERYERRQETEYSRQTHALTIEDLHIRYVKQIVLQAMRRSSFYATVGISQLLYSYTHSETRAIYDWLAADEVGFKDDSAFRFAKARLKSSLNARFSAFFSNSDESQDLNSKTPCSDLVLGNVVERSLAIFTPQPGNCPPSAFFEGLAFEAGIVGLSDSTQGDNRIEQTRVHIVICPSCFSRLNHCLGNPPPSEKLRLPLFFLSGDKPRDSVTSSEDYLLPDLTFNDFYEILR
jgi:hypothetical protein